MRQPTKSVQTEIKGCMCGGLHVMVFGRWLQDKHLRKAGLLIAPRTPYLEAFVVCMLSYE